MLRILKDIFKACFVSWFLVFFYVSLLLCHFGEKYLAFIIQERKSRQAFLSVFLSPNYVPIFL